MGTVYATRTDLTRLAIAAQALGGISTDTQDAALASASSTIDSYLQGRFKLPLASYGIDITECACAIAAWLLIKGRGLQPGNEAWESLRSGYTDALRWLKDVSDGRALPAFPTAKDADQFTPVDKPFVLAPLSGTAGLGAGSFHSKDSDDNSLAVGTPAPPRLRGW